jgi:hypothetical protein
MKARIFKGSPAECERKINDWLEGEKISFGDVDAITQSAVTDPLPNKEEMILAISVFYSKKR